MIGAIARAVDRMRGYGEADVTVPVLDGPLKPNRALDGAAVLASLPGADNLAVMDGALLCTGGNTVYTLDAGPAPVARFTRAGPITALAAGEGCLATAAEAEGIAVTGGRHDGLRVATLGEARAVCITALMFVDADTLLVAVGSSVNGAADWKRDLMSRQSKGSLWLVALGSGAAKKIADDLGFPYGLCRQDGRRVLVSESWRHRVLSVDLDDPKARTVLVHDLPAYPARLAPASDGGFWLALFAPRDQLIEFVLREPRYCRRMLAEVPAEFWVAPALSSGAWFEEPLQGGGVKQMGILKPWAPTRSYGLVARCNAAGAAVASYHSRADGARHGTTAACAWGGQLCVASKGAGLVLSLPLGSGETAQP